MQVNYAVIYISQSTASRYVDPVKTKYTSIITCSLLTHIVSTITNNNEEWYITHQETCQHHLNISLLLYAETFP